MTWSWLAALALVIIPLGALAALFIAGNRMRTGMVDSIQALPGFQSCEVLASIDVAVAVDHANSQIAVAWNKKGAATESKILPAASLSRVEIERIVPGSTTRKARARTYSTKDSAQRILLCIEFKDRGVPFIQIPIYERVGDGTAPFSDSHESSAMDKARRWELTIRSLMNTQTPSVVALATELGPEKSISDEVQRLHHLMKDGALTEAEFAAAKARLLQV